MSAILTKGQGSLKAVFLALLMLGSVGSSWSAERREENVRERDDRRHEQKDDRREREKDRDDDHDRTKKVSVILITPQTGAIYTAPGNVTLVATAQSRQKEHPVTKVEFYQGTTLIGTATSAPYTLAWNGVPAGNYRLTAKAYTGKGEKRDEKEQDKRKEREKDKPDDDTAVSTPVDILVNAPPSVSLAAIGAPYIAPADATLTANASDSDGSIAKVEFYNGTTLIGTSTAGPYTVSLSGLAAGSYSLTAIATDNRGASTTSAPALVTVAPNQLPTVVLTSPASNQVLPAPATLTLTASATDADGTITKVEFYSGTTLIGTSTTAPYGTTWSNVPSGSYSLTAVATDDKGGTTTSSPVMLTVSTPPTVSLSSPSAGSVGIAPASFTLTANASDSDGSIAQVAFYQGSTLIGTATSAAYTLEWSNVAAGTYSLAAQATDNLGLQTTSSPIIVSVIANTAPSITLTSPTQGLSIKAPATITLTATASDAENNLAKVEFVQNGTLIATVLSPPYTTTWSNVAQGSYQITAIATDALGAQTTSDPVTITVTPAQASVYYIHADHLGTPRLVTDEQNSIVWRNLPTTEPFGNTMPEEDPQATGNRFELPLAFPGQYRDRESGLSYNYFRDYDPNTGRYVQSDPIGLRGGINLYQYANSNPLSFVDPLGLEVEVGVRKFYPYSVPYARHCFVRFNGNNQDTLSYSNKGITPDPNPGGASYSPTRGKENDSCVRKEMKKCRAEDYDFTQFNCCMCASNALDTCGLQKDGSWPNAPRDASDPPYPKPLPAMPPVVAP